MPTLRPKSLDYDPQETRDWLDSLDSVFWVAGSERAAFLLAALNARATELGVLSDELAFSAYRNTIPPENQPPFPGDLELEERITAINRWNALAMVMRANLAAGELGGHIASYASGAEIFEVGFNHFFRAETESGGGGDLVYFQPHSAPGIYARAFLEGRLSEHRLEHFRREIGGVGLSSYPHPWLMPDFWQMPTGSMGIGPISAIYQARFLRYLADRGLAETAGRRVWGYSATVRWTSRNRWLAFRWRGERALTTLCSSSTATCSGSMGQCAATGRSSRNWRGPFAAPAGMS
jgi:pyruvate dehydrogenase E1 component